MGAVDQGELSRLLFGRVGRLRLVRWILENVPIGEVFHATEAQRGIGDVPSEVKANLTRLLELGVIKPAHRASGPGRPQYFQRLESPIWRIFEEALELTNGPRRPGARSRGTHS